jgi:hypothetical protein
MHDVSLAVVDVDRVGMIAVANEINDIVVAVAGDCLLTDRRSIRAKERDCVIRHTAPLVQRLAE